jgi:hypothetical protein
MHYMKHFLLSCSVENIPDKMLDEVVKVVNDLKSWLSDFAVFSETVDSRYSAVVLHRLSYIMMLVCLFTLQYCFA